MIRMIGEYMLRGASVAAWVIGFVAVLGLFIGIVILFCLAMGEIFGKDERNEDAKRDAGGAGAGIEGSAAEGRAGNGTVDLRRKRRSFGSSI